MEPGNEVIEVKTGTPEHEQALKLQREQILRRVTELYLYSPAIAYTWSRPTLRLSASEAFGTKFRPLVHRDRSGAILSHVVCNQNVDVPPILPAIQAVPVPLPRVKK